MIKSWIVIGAVTIAIALLGSILKPDDAKWFRRLRRPDWLTFEGLIPIIWTVVLICGAWSAYIVWETDPGSQKTWWLMAFYALVEVVIISYSPITLRLRSLKAGTIAGAAGFVLGVILAMLVFPVSNTAGLLLLPYLLWSPIGTYATWAMAQLNPEST